MAFRSSIIFPHDISYNSEGSEVFSTDVNVSDSGHDQRIAHWDQPLMEYNIAYGVRTMEQLHELRRMFRSVRGQKDSFLYRDIMDYTSSYATGEEAREPDAITNFDQVIGTGDGQETVFQLTKSYAYEGVDASRDITKPIEGTVIVAAAGVPYPESAYAVDHLTGIVTFASRGSNTIGQASFDYESTIRTITWDDAATIDDVLVGDWVQISGFLLTNNRIPESEAWQVLLIDNDNKKIKFTCPSGHDTGLGTTEANADFVTLSVIAAPKLNAEVTAGYEFHVPVRFATDRLPISLEAFGIGSASDISLIEVRESETM